MSSRKIIIRENPRVNVVGTPNADIVVLYSGFDNGVVVYQIERQEGTDRITLTSNSRKTYHNVNLINSQKLEIVLSLRTYYKYRVRRNNGSWTDWVVFKTRNRDYKLPDIYAKTTKLSDKLYVYNEEAFTEVNTSSGSRIVSNDTYYNLEVTVPSSSSTSTDITLSGSQIFGMSVEDISLSDDRTQITVQTTGAQYVITQSQIDMYRRIDPSTNSEDPRLVARIDFSTSPGSWTVTQADREESIFSSSLATISVYADSLMVIERSGGLTVTHNNLIDTPTWNKTSGASEIWTDGNGGSLIAKIAQGSASGHMVFPPRTFNFDALYGTSARPGYIAIDTQSAEDNVLNFHATMLTYYLGIANIWVSATTSNPDIKYGTVAEYGPVTLTAASGEFEGLKGYEWNDASAMQTLIDDLHTKGYKVIGYMMVSGTGNFDTQNISDTLAWMSWFKTTYNIDGWYFDNARYVGLDDVNGYTDNWRKTHYFIREVRKMLGDDGIIFHHNSVDILSGASSGFRSIMIDAYSNYMLSGETGTLSAAIHDPIDDFLRYYAGGYGMSQTLGILKRNTNNKSGIGRDEWRRLSAQNLHALDRTVNSILTLAAHYDVEYIPFYETNKSAYQADTLDMDVDYPPTWFVEIDAGAVSLTIATTTCEVDWTTGVATTSTISWAATSSTLWDPADPWSLLNEITVDDSVGAAETMTHQITITGLTAATDYIFRIRSRTGSGVNQIIHGYYGTFTTAA